MASKRALETPYGTLHFFEKSVRIDSIAETLFFGRDPIPDIKNIESFLNKIYTKGRQHKSEEIRNIIASD